MNIGRLKELIEALDDDLEVYIHADHGQTYENAWSTDEVLMKDEEREMFAVHPDDQPNHEAHELTKGFVIYG